MTKEPKKRGRPPGPSPLTSWRKRHSGAKHKTKADLEAEWEAERQAEPSVTRRSEAKEKK